MDWHVYAIVRTCSRLSHPSIDAFSALTLTDPHVQKAFRLPKGILKGKMAERFPSPICMQNRPSIVVSHETILMTWGPPTVPLNCLHWTPKYQEVSQKQKLVTSFINLRTIVEMMTTFSKSFKVVRELHNFFACTLFWLESHQWEKTSANKSATPLKSVWQVWVTPIPGVSYLLLLVWIWPIFAIEGNWFQGKVLEEFLWIQDQKK